MYRQQNIFEMFFSCFFKYDNDSGFYIVLFDPSSHRHELSQEKVNL